jgi:hypothetical protein
MAEPHPADELKVLRDLLDRLQSGALTMKTGGKDVTKREINILKREIAFLEKIIARLKGQNA